MAIQNPTGSSSTYQYPVISDASTAVTLNPAAAPWFSSNKNLHAYVKPYDLNNYYYLYYSPTTFYISNALFHLPSTPFLIYQPQIYLQNPSWFQSIHQLPPPPPPPMYLPQDQSPLFTSVSDQTSLSLFETELKNTTGRGRVRGRGRGGDRGTKVSVSGKRVFDVVSIDETNEDVTTVMLRNIPNNYTREMLIEFLDKHCKEANEEAKEKTSEISAYDFLYLPMDFKSKMNKGYAFVNFTNAKAVWKFYVAYNKKPWLCFNSRKVLEIVSARIQGKRGLVRHFEHMIYPDKAYSAVCFSPARSGPMNKVRAIMVGKIGELLMSE